MLDRDMTYEEKRLRAENERLREALRPFVVGARHTRLFLTSRERMHPAGVDLYDEAVAAGRSALGKTADDGS